MVQMRIPTNDVTLEVAVDGDDSAPAVFLLHGFPDTHALWRHQVGVLVEAGYRTIAPDLRGFGNSDKPEAIDAYGLLDLAADVTGVLDHLGVERANIVGHDWGAALGWALAAFAPDRVASLAALSVGHPKAFRNAGLVQREKSWYMLLFQFEGVAEQWLSDDGFANFKVWAHHPDADEVIGRLSNPAALRSSLALYRANLPPEWLVTPAMEFPPVQCPTLGVWSTGDIALTEQQMLDSAAYVTGRWQYEQVAGAGHWMQLDAPAQVNALLLNHLAAAF
jgi:pimeloyl-ACP methyl ester carboxylesterase